MHLAVREHCEWVINAALLHSLPTIGDITLTSGQPELEWVSSLDSLS